jgi:hypothetical protein
MSFNSFFEKYPNKEYPKLWESLYYYHYKDSNFEYTYRGVHFNKSEEEVKDDLYFIRNFTPRKKSNGLLTDGAFRLLKLFLPDL